MLLNERGFFDCNTAHPGVVSLCVQRGLYGDASRRHIAALPAGRPGLLAAASAMIQTAYQRGFHRFDWVHRRADGVDFPADVLLTAFELDGELVLQATVRDLTDLKRRERESDAVRRGETRYRLLSDISQALSARLDMQGLFELIAEQTARVMYAENMIIALYDPIRHEVEFVFSRNPDEVTARHAAAGSTAGMTGYVVRHRKSVLLHDDMADEPNA